MRAPLAAPRASMLPATILSATRSLRDVVVSVVVSVVSLISLISLSSPAARLASGAAGQ